MLILVQLRMAESSDDLSEQRGWSREIKKDVRASAARLHLRKMLGDFGVGIRIVGIGAEVGDAAPEIGPSIFAEIARVLGMRGSFFEIVAELLVADRLAPNAQDIEVRRHAAHTGQIVESGNQLPACKVAGRAKDDQNARFGFGQRWRWKWSGGPDFDDSCHERSLSFGTLFSSRAHKRDFAQRDPHWELRLQSSPAACPISAPAEL